MGTAGHALLLDCRELSSEPVAIATGLALARPDLDVWVVGGDGEKGRGDGDQGQRERVHEADQSLGCCSADQKRGREGDQQRAAHQRREQPGRADHHQLEVGQQGTQAALIAMTEPQANDAAGEQPAGDVRV